MSTKVELSAFDRNLLRSLINCVTTNVRNTESGDMVAGVLNASSLPYTINGGEFQSYTVITTGVVTINSITVPEGTYTWTAPNNGTLTALEIDGAGSVVITTTKKA